MKFNEYICIRRDDTHKVWEIHNRDLTLRKFIQEIRTHLNDSLDLPDTPGSPNLDVLVNPETAAEVDNLLYISFEPFNRHPLRNIWTFD